MRELGSGSRGKARGDTALVHGLIVIVDREVNGTLGPAESPHVDELVVMVFVVVVVVLLALRGDVNWDSQRSE